MVSIITVPNPLLREKSKAVTVDKKTLGLVKLLKETLIDREGKMKGVGLSAIQLGIPKKVFVAHSLESQRILTFINPEILWYSKRQTNEKNRKFEGCLSVPNKWSLIKRSKSIKIKYQTQSGQTQVRQFSDLTATVVQHEYDHLNGILFIDRALEQGAKIYELAKDEEGKEYLKEIKL